jgi:hypothetical protein
MVADTDGLFEQPTMAYEDAILGELIGLGGGEPRQSEYNGTKALMMAVFEGGIHDYCRAVGHRYTQAECWVRSRHRGVFSFVVVCETLGLEPSAVRQALVRLKTQLMPSRIRPKVSRRRSMAKSR